jgi:hypothetical protein
MAGWFAGGNEEATAHIDDDITIEQDGVSETMSISLDFVGDNQEVEQAALDYKLGGEGQSASQEGARVQSPKP